LRRSSSELCRRAAALSARRASDRQTVQALLSAVAAAAFACEPIHMATMENDVELATAT